MSNAWFCKIGSSKRLIALALLTIPFDFCSLVLAQTQKSDYSWDGWHRAPDPSSIQYKVFHDRVVALSNLSKGCNPGHPFSFAGRIAKVNFDNQGLRVEKYPLGLGRLAELSGM